MIYTHIVYTYKGANDTWEPRSWRVASEWNDENDDGLANSAMVWRKFNIHWDEWIRNTRLKSKYNKFAAHLYKLLGEQPLAGGASEG